MVVLMVKIVPRSFFETPMPSRIAEKPNKDLPRAYIEQRMQAYETLASE